MESGKFDECGRNGIQINAKKLLDWLVNRRICKPDWRPSLSAIHKKIKLSINQMPEHDEIKTILSNNLDYSRCKQIVEILKTTEESAKNIFGRYCSKTMKDWLEIVSLYEKNNMFLVEVCNSFNQIVQYDLPSVKSKHSKNLQLINELQKRKQVAVGEATAAADEIVHFCADYFIEYEPNLDFERKLRSSYDLICNHNREIISLAQILQPYVDFYKKFVSKTHNFEHSLPHLELLIVAGNVGEEPDVGEIQLESTQSNKKNDGSDSEVEFADEIDFGDFDNEKTGTKNTNRNEKQVSLLDDRKFVYNILTEIKELEIFFEIRAFDEKNSEFVNYSDKLIDDTKSILAKTRSCTQKILDHKMQIIKQVLSSEKCFKNSVSNYHNKVAKKSKLESKIENYISQIIELTASNIELSQKKTELIKNALLLKQKIEVQLSNNYLNNQKVNIIGDFR